MRSKLFVPGARPELFGKALASAADAISIDLEDAVVEARKGEARAAVAAFLCSSEAQASSKSIIVRVNALATAHFSADARVVASLSLALVNLPKVESALEVDAAVDIIDRAFVDVGLRPTLCVLANIESPKGLRNVGGRWRARSSLAPSMIMTLAVRIKASNPGVDCVNRARRFFEIDLALVNPSWTAHEAWPGSADELTSAVEQINALFITVRDGEGQPDRILQWKAGEGWKDRGTAPAALVPGSASALGQAHGSMASLVTSDVTSAPAASPVCIRRVRDICTSPRTRRTSGERCARK
jgi:hypothetical protein